MAIDLSAIPNVYAKSAAEWRAWLRKNGAKESRAFLVYYKKATGAPSVSYREALMEAICFGWIDTVVRRLDDDRYGTVFVRRGANARWSENTMRYAGDLLAKGKMTKAGIAAWERGKTKPVFKPAPKDIKPAPDLLSAIGKKGGARVFFDSLPPSARRIYIAWVENAKRPETRMRRIAAVAERCAQKKRWGE